MESSSQTKFSSERNTFSHDVTSETLKAFISDLALRREEALATVTYED